MNVVDMNNEKKPSGAARLIAVHRMLPNLMTLTAMAAGLTSIQYALNMQWDRAVVAVLIALVLDGMDGAVARLLKATSDFGGQLDNLSDFLAFGVAPSIILYTWLLEESGKVGWMAMIFYTCATALRLARFHVEQKNAPKWKEGFFSGIPSPAGAGLALLPLILWLQIPDFFKQFSVASPLVGLWTISVATLMVSRVPTFSIKTIRLPAKMGTPLLACAALLMAALVTVPWLTLTILCLTYMASIPFAVLRFRRLKKDHQHDDDQDPAELADL